MTLDLTPSPDPHHLRRSLSAAAANRLRDWQSRPHIGAMHLDLSDEEAAPLAQELHDIVESDRYPFSPRIRTLRAILNKLRPEPVREPLPPPKDLYAPPRAVRTRGNSVAIISTGEPPIGSRSAFVVRGCDPISGPCGLTYSR